MITLQTIKMNIQIPKVSTEICLRYLIFSLQSFRVLLDLIEEKTYKLCLHKLM